MTPEVLQTLIVAIISIVSSTGIYKWIWVPFREARKETEAQRVKLIESLQNQLKAQGEQLDKQNLQIASQIANFSALQKEFETERTNRRRDVAEAHMSAQAAQDEAAKAKTVADTAERARKEEQSAANARIERLQLAFNASEHDRLKMVDEIGTFKAELEQTRDRYQQVVDALDKQAERHDQEMITLNNETFGQLSKMKFETAAVRDMYQQVQEEQQKQGKEIMELTVKVENARKILLMWGLRPEQIEGLLTGQIDPAQVEKCVHDELEKHLAQPAPLPENEPLPPMTPFQSEVTAPAIQSVEKDKPPEPTPVVDVKIEEKAAEPPKENKPNDR